jgi:hypothetical protein
MALQAFKKKKEKLTNAFVLIFSVKTNTGHVRKKEFEEGEGENHLIQGDL